MADSVFLILNSGQLPTATDVAEQYERIGSNASLDVNWQWSSLEGWLPATYLGGESGFEVITDEISAEQNQEFAITDRPELTFLVELTPRGGPSSLAAMLTFAAAVVASGQGIIEIDEDARVTAADAPDWYEQEISRIDDWIAGEAKKEMLKTTLLASGKTPEELLDEALATLVGQKITFRGGNLMLRTEDNSMIMGSRCEVMENEKTVVAHGSQAKLRDRQTELMWKFHPNPTDSQMAEVEAIDSGIREAKAEDEEARSVAYEIMKRWIGNVSVSSANRDKNNVIILRLSDGHTIKFVTSGNFSMVTIHAGGIRFVLNGPKVSI
jgi:hypothetical protein